MMPDEFDSFVEPVKVRMGQPAPVLPGDFGVIDKDVSTTMWFDPGVAVGWCVISVWSIALTDIRFRLLSNLVAWSAGEYRGTEDQVVDQMFDLVEAWEGNLGSVGLEDFILRQFSMGRELLAPVRVTARFEDRMYVANKSGLLVPKQQPSLAMSMVTDERLKLWQLYNYTTGKPHARDALRHGLTYLRRMKTVGAAVAG